MNKNQSTRQNLERSLLGIGSKLQDNLPKTGCHLPSLRASKVVAGKTSFKFDFDVFLPSRNANLQRGLVWDDVQKSGFLLAIVRENPIPFFHFYTNTRAKIVHVIDGKQRLNAVFGYLRGEFGILLEGHDPVFFAELVELAPFAAKAIANFDPCAIEIQDEDVALDDNDLIEWFAYVNFLGTAQDQLHIKKLQNQNTK